MRLESWDGRHHEAGSAHHKPRKSHAQHAGIHHLDHRREGCHAVLARQCRGVGNLLYVGGPRKRPLACRSAEHQRQGYEERHRNRDGSVPTIVIPEGRHG